MRPVALKSSALVLLAAVDGDAAAGGDGIAEVELEEAGVGEFAAGEGVGAAEDEGAGVGLDETAGAGEVAGEGDGVAAGVERDAAVDVGEVHVQR